MNHPTLSVVKPARVTSADRGPLRQVFDTEGCRVRGRDSLLLLLFSYATVTIVLKKICLEYARQSWRKEVGIERGIARHS